MLIDGIQPRQVLTRCGFSWPTRERLSRFLIVSQPAIAYQTSNVAKPALCERVKSLHQRRASASGHLRCRLLVKPIERQKRNLLMHKTVGVLVARDHQALLRPEPLPIHGVLFPSGAEILLLALRNATGTPSIEAEDL